MDFTAMTSCVIRNWLRCQPRTSDGNFVWPTDPDEVPDWRRAQEELARRGGYSLPGDATKREHDAWIASAMKNLVDDTPKNAPKIITNVVPIKKQTVRLSAHEAAQRFADDIRRKGKAIKLSTDELSQSYKDHCIREGLIELPENKFRDALSKLRGVSRYQKSMKNRHGRRQRVMTWVIEAAPVARPALKEMRAVA